MPNVDLIVCHNGQSHRYRDVALPLNLCRQSIRVPKLHELSFFEGETWLAIVDRDHRSVSRHALRLVNAPENSVRIVNPHQSLTVQIDVRDETLLPKQHVDLSGDFVAELPGSVQISVHIRQQQPIPPSVDGAYATVRAIATDESQLSRNELGDLLGGQIGQADASGTILFEADDQTGIGATAVKLVQEVLQILRHAAHTDQFFESALRSAANMIGLNSAAVILRDHDQWNLAALYSHVDDSMLDEESLGDAGLPIGSDPLLHRVLRDQKTITFDAVFDPHASMALPVERAVASPMKDDDGNVLGVLYGERWLGQTEYGNEPLKAFELKLLEVMAAAVSAGLARQHHEEMRLSMNQFFSPEVVGHLQRDPDLMKGREADVSVLFCDIRGFSRVSEKIGPEMTFEWINDLMTSLSEAVRKHNGVLVDYIGDELLAMWGAPASQSNHGVLAASAATEMMAMVAQINQRWMPRIQEPFDIGVGISSGIAQVGNTGSRTRFKYGPLGSVVNLASRVQNLTKHFGVRGIVTEETHQHLVTDQTAGLKTSKLDCPTDNKWKLRRLSKVRPLGMATPVMLFQLHEGGDQFEAIRDAYERALNHFEAAQFSEAARELSNLINEHPGDIPSLNLLGRVVDQMRTDGEDFDPVYCPTSK